MITLGMFVLLMVSVISANRVLIENAETIATTDGVASASYLATDLIAEILSKPFDQTVIDRTKILFISGTDTVWRQDTTGIRVSTESGLSTYGGSAWGIRTLVTLPDSSYTGDFRSRAKLKDIDDYDGYWRLVSGFVGSEPVTYSLRSRVYYVGWTAPEDTTQSTTRTFFKYVVVTAENTFYKVNQRYTALASY